VKEKLLSFQGVDRVRRSDNEIRAILEAHAKSGLSLLAFSQDQDLCYASLRRWRIQHGRRSQDSDDPSPLCRRGSTPRFVPVQVEPPSTKGEFGLSWPSGRSLRIPAGFDPDELRRVLAVLEERS